MPSKPQHWEIVLTEGALNNGYLPLPDRFPLAREDTPTAQTRITLEMDGLDPVETTVDDKHRRFRWRGCRSFYRAHHLAPGDMVLMTRKARARYRLAPRRLPSPSSPEAPQDIDRFTNKVICGDALAIMRQLPSASVHLIVTSPPYWNLVDYHVHGQIGQSWYRKWFRAVMSCFGLARNRQPQNTQWLDRL